ncbi:hypothetical protein [Streptomyces sp. NPDC002962]|uniref:hypothetical protein n=1 Tax=Streptomyces sp. NPDC002962 TaxID=3364674 RepID=UPI00368B98C7
MAHWEVAIPFTSQDGCKGTHFFTYPLHHYPEPTAAGAAAASDALSDDAVRHRKGGALAHVAATPVLRVQTLGI